jgi:hypothetical protein
VPQHCWGSNAILKNMLLGYNRWGKVVSLLVVVAAFVVPESCALIPQVFDPGCECLHVRPMSCLLALLFKSLVLFSFPWWANECIFFR